MTKLPTHVAIIMDGNGRWAKKKGLPRVSGHIQGAKQAKEIIRVAEECGVKYITLYSFSSENWNRPEAEVSFLMKLISQKLEEEIGELVEKNVRFGMIGDRKRLSDEVCKRVDSAIEATRSNTGLHLTIALSYSSRNEILAAVKDIAQDIQRGTLAPEAITEEKFSQYLMTKDLPDPDLLIRTSGEFRISNFLLWQLSYAELYVTDTLWPDFGKEEFQKALESYGKRERRYGLTEPTH